MGTSHSRYWNESGQLGSQPDGNIIFDCLPYYYTQPNKSLVVVSASSFQSQIMFATRSVRKTLNSSAACMIEQH